jgi:ABC-type polysaccharide/polyol phosphate transport system ATPase subunit
MSAISIQRVSKHFKILHLKPKSLKEAFIRKFWNRQLQKTEFWALDDVSFDIQQGQTVGIIGTNGSGKSTLLKTIAGILTPTKGSIEVKGQLAALLELGAGFHPDFSGRENIVINGVMLGLSRKEINYKMDEIIDFAELEKFIDNPVKTYSSGMYMRLGFSIAVNINPDILLIDEILAVGDYAFQKKCFNKMDEFKKNNKTIVFVSHDLGTVEQFCSHAAWLHNGKLLSFGPVKTVLNEYTIRIDEELRIAADKEHISVTGNLTHLDSTRRWGTREVEINGFRLFDKDSKERYFFETGEQITLSIDFLAREIISDPVFEIGIYRSDGTCVYGTNTGLENIKLGTLSKGTGHLKIEIDKLDLIEEKYWFDLGIKNRVGQYYDFHYRVFSMTVNSSIKDVGIYRLPHKWFLQ